LDLSSNDLGDAAASALAGSESLFNLCGLNLGECEISDGGARALAPANTLIGLRQPYLASNLTTDDGVKALPHSRKFATLLDLNLSDNNITDIGGRAPADSTHIPREAVLQLGAANFSPDTREALKQRYRAVIFTHAGSARMPASNASSSMCPKLSDADRRFQHRAQTRRGEGSARDDL
jgi:hypothetical protein